MITMGIWYTYIDWTLEDSPRCFYVGKGNYDRTCDVLTRNVVWHRIAKKYGHRREIVFSSSIELACFDQEQDLIREYNTCPYANNGWGANLSLGGPGPTGAKWSVNAKKRLAMTVTSMWKDPTYRHKLMTLCPVSVEQLKADNLLMTWDDLARKYDVSATTIKRWFTHFGLTKSIVKQGRKCWNNDDDARVMKLYKSGSLVREISSQLDRSECSIKKRIQKLCNAAGIERSRYRRHT